MSALHVACGADRAWVPHSATMLHSLLAENCGAHVHFMHSGDLGTEVLARLRSHVEGLGGAISFVEVGDERLPSLATTAILPTSHWYRVFLPQLLPGLDRVLYLDSDLIVRGSLRELWEADLSDDYVAAVTNLFPDDQLPRLARLGFDDPNAYFNSGVMLLALDTMRTEQATEAVVEWAAANAERIDIPDQDSLNAVLGHRRVHLHPRWNLMTSLVLFPQAREMFGAEAIEEARRDPVIRHFEGPHENKPWHYLCKEEGRELYAEHRRQTPWPAFEPEGRTLARRVRRRLRSA